MADTTSHVSPEDARRFARDVLVGNGVPAHHAEIVARCLVEADLRGVDTHGESIGNMAISLQPLLKGLDDQVATGSHRT